MSNPGELRDRLRLTLLPVPHFVDTLRRELGLTEAKARAMLAGLEAAGKVITFPDPDGVERVAVVGNYSPEDRAV